MGNVSNFNGGNPWPAGPGSQSFQQPWANSSQNQSQPQQMQQQHPSSGKYLRINIIFFYA